MRRRNAAATGFLGLALVGAAIAGASMTTTACFDWKVTPVDGGDETSTPEPADAAAQSDGAIDQ